MKPIAVKLTSKVIDSRLTGGQWEKDPPRRREALNTPALYHLRDR